MYILSKFVTFTTDINIDTVVERYYDAYAQIISMSIFAENCARVRQDSKLMYVLARLEIKQEGPCALVLHLCCLCAVSNMDVLANAPWQHLIGQMPPVRSLRRGFRCWLVLEMFSYVH